ncbi:MAG: serine/threonine-protein kinase [Planctomycetota bacterium]
MTTVGNDPLLRHLARTDDGGVEMGPVIIRDRLGKGGMGSVFLAHHKSLDIDVAVKIIPVEDDDKENAAALRFMREAQTAAKISHPNLVRVFALGEERGLKYIIQEYVKGMPGGEYMEQHGSLSESLALQIIAQIALALESAHEKGVVHRDVKPDNILITEEEEMTVKLSDLGLAKKVDMSSSDEIELDFNITSANTAIGTPHFMAPEQVTDAKNVDHRADIYSLGVTLYQFLSLDLPFVSDNIYGLFHIILNGEPKPLRQVAPNLMESAYRLVDWMTQKDPNRRPQSAGDVFDAADAILACIETGTDDWYPPGQGPRVASPLTLQVNIEPPAPIEITAYPQRPMPPTAPPPFRPPTSLPQSDARKRLSLMRNQAEAVANQGENPVEFFVPDVLKQRERLDKIRTGATGQREPVQRRESTGYSEEALKEKTRKITQLRKAVTDPTTDPIDIRKLQKQSTGVLPKISETKRVVVVEPLPGSRSRVAIIILLLIITLSAVGVIFRDRLKTFVSTFQPPPDSPVRPPVGKQGVPESIVIKYDDYKVDFDRIAGLMNDRNQWPTVIGSCDTILQNLEKQAGNDEADAVIDWANRIKKVIDLMERAINASGNREASDFQLQAFETAPKEIQSSSFNFYIHLNSRTAKMTVELHDDAKSIEDRFVTLMTGKTIKSYNPKKIRTVRCWLNEYQDIQVSLEKKTVNGFEIALSTTFPDTVELGKKAEKSILLTSPTLAPPVLEGSFFYIVSEKNKIAQVRSGLERAEYWELPLKSITIRTVSGLARHPKSGIYLLFNDGAGDKLAYIRFFRTEPLQSLRDIDREPVAGPFINDAGAVLVVVKDGVMTNVDSDTPGFVAIEGGICAATNRRDLALGLENGGVVLFDKNTLTVKSLPILPQAATGGSADGIAYLRYNENGERLMAVTRKGFINDMRGSALKTIRLQHPAAAEPTFGLNDSAFIALTNGELFTISGESASPVMDFLKAVEMTAGQAPAKLSSSGVWYQNFFYFLIADRLLTYDKSGALNVNVKLAIESSVIDPPMIVDVDGRDQLVIRTEKGLYLYNLPIQP